MENQRTLLIEFDHYDKNYKVGDITLTINWPADRESFVATEHVKVIAPPGELPELILTVNGSLYRLAGTAKYPNIVCMINERYERVNITQFGVQVKELFIGRDHPGLQFLHYQRSRHEQRQTATA